MYKFQEEMVTAIWLDKMLMLQSITNHKSMMFVTARQANKYVTQSEPGQQDLHQLALATLTGRTHSTVA